jgi:hypothetical protein
MNPLLLSHPKLARGWKGGVVVTCALSTITLPAIVLMVIVSPLTAFADVIVTTPSDFTAPDTTW